MKIQFILMICILVIFSGCATSKDVNHLERRMSQLEAANQSLLNRIQQLKTDIENQQTAENGLRDMYAGQGAEFNQFKEGISHLNGRFDETEYRIQQDIQSLKSSLKNHGNTIDHFSQTVSQNQNRIQRIESYVGYEPGGEDTAKGKDVAVPKEKMTEEELYDVSKQAYDRADYETARQGFEKFLEIYEPLKDKENVILQEVMPIEEVMQFLSNSRCLVSNDTGVRNMGISLETPTVGIFFAIPPFRYWPREDKHDCVFNIEYTSPSVDAVFESTKILVNKLYEK